MKIVSNDIATSQGHWYEMSTGAPCYTIVGKNGVERHTTLRDARVMNLAPSVTTVTKCAAAPGLLNWQIDQAIMAALTLTRLDRESDDEFISRVKRDSKEQAKKAAERGTEIHGALERHYQGKPVDGEMWPFVKATTLNLKMWFGDIAWDPERSFAHPLGYGGKCDLHAKAERIVVDFKGKDFEDPADCKLYDEHLMQGAAYLEGFGLREGGRFANCFISRNKPGLVCIVEAKPEEIARGWRMFRTLLSYWQEAHAYRPITKEAA